MKRPPETQNIFADVTASSADEDIRDLFTSKHVRIERIVSSAHRSPPGFWYDQAQAEWVMVLAGSAGLQIEGEDEARTLRVGDHVFLDAHVRHRVEWTDADQPTVWLAVHFDPSTK